MGNGGELWPAEIVHVNEDGWVLVNRGRGHGVTLGMWLLVVGDTTRELRDVFAGDTPPVLLRIRRTYELLEVVYAEEQCAVAIAARVPRERRPQVYRAPGGELLVWVPLATEYTWPAAVGAGAADDAGDEASDAQDADQNLDDGAVDEGGAGEQEAEGTQSLADQQDDDRWEQALPLNGVEVGDLVLPAIPVAFAGDAQAHAAAEPGAAAALIEHHDTPFDAGRAYDWLKPSS
ncbi:MAG TPA: hypothetical protein VJQ45_00750 [Ktedonobacterales bacterium]|nr:hypothetical protein [Ktedonobacterales bacterium]